MLVLKINDRLKIRTIKHFNNVKIGLKYDSIASTFEFSFYFNPDNHDLEELACVSHYHEAIIEYNGEVLLTGYIVSQSFTSTPTRQMSHFSGCSKTGFLAHCQIPPSSFPLQSNGLSLRQITQKIIQPFDIKLVIDPNVYKKTGIIYTAKQNPDTPDPKRKKDPITYVTQQLSLDDKVDNPIDESTADISQIISDYITELAVQRNIILSHDEKGNLLLTEAKTKMLPIFHLEKGMIGVVMSLSFKGEQLHSDITVVKQADSDGGNASQYTIQNPYVPIVYRPKTVVMSSGDSTTAQEAAQNALAAELKSIQLIINIDRWVLDGKIIRPNNVISVLNSDLYIYEKSNWFIESVDYEGDQEKQIATLTCVLQECYNGQYPSNVFVDAHENSGTGFTSNV